MNGFVGSLPHENDRHPNCPLNPLPEGYGRLIDADVAIKEVFDCRDYLTEMAEATRDTKYLEQAYGVNEAAGKLLNVPTILEAEVKEDV